MLPRMENIKCRFSFFNNWSTSRSVLALNTDDSKILGKLQSFRSSIPISMPQESSQSDIGVKRYGQNTNTSQNISTPGLFPSLA